MIFIYRIIVALSLSLALAALSGCETTTTGGAVDREVIGSFRDLNGGAG